MTKESSSSDNAVAVVEPDSVIDYARVERAASWIHKKLIETVDRGARDIGEYVLKEFFKGDPEFASSRDPYKNASFRDLADKCGTPEIPVSKSWLHNAVAVAIMIRQLPQGATAFKQLALSHQAELLPLRDPAKVEKVAKEAVTMVWTVSHLREVVAKKRSKTPKDESKGGRSPTPVIVKTLNRSLKVFTLEGGKRSFTKAQVEELDEQQKKDAVESAEGLIEKLKDLVIKLKKA
jgi:hypothetical protein